ncbi:UDP-glycosyltransferase 87A1-like [Pistacia vera]|uniref:UDP-glycosyltransferase 87A1-like n=1 Tax=Pistacia vera TaxID=55513 RepID=UPI001262E582|nr:UDP-glycosyltransferase 87A1-like [Pistacia vera]
MYSTAICHVVAMPYPGRGHINPLMNLCKLLVSRKQDIIITFVVTEEWLGLIGSNPRPDNIRFRTIPNVIPSERVRAQDFPGFYEAVMTKMEAPFEQLLDRLEPPVTAIIADLELRWPINLGTRRNIPVAALWTASTLYFSLLYHFYQFSKEHLAVLNLPDHVDYIPGISSSNIADLKTVFHKNDNGVLQLLLDCISRVPKAQYLLFTSIYELEPQVTNNLISAFPFPVYHIGPAIPYLELKNDAFGSNCNSANEPDYIRWLDSKAADSVLYISLGSFLSVSSAQMDEILAGLQNSSVCFMWVTRGEASQLEEICGDKGLVLPWCDQLKVLCHSSVGGFWTHCGWNSTLEAVFAGVPMLTFPLCFDQDPNSNQIVEDWKIGWRVKKEIGSQNIVTREEISDLVQRFMDLSSNEGKEMRRNARQVRDTCHGAIAEGEGGSSVINLNAFIRDILKGQSHK